VIYDARIKGQRDLAPNDLRWMNVIQVSVLSNPTMNAFQWNQFVDYMRSKGMYSTNFQRLDPLARPISVQADVYCTNIVDLETAKASIRAALIAFLQPRRGLLGLDIFKSDIYDVIADATVGIDYINLRSPTVDVISTFNKISALAGDAIYKAGAALAPGFYSYGVSVTTPSGGETLPVVINNIAVSGQAVNAVTLAWPPVPGAVSYKVYGRTQNSLRFLGFVPANQNPTSLTYVDEGVTTPTTPVPSIDSSGVFYPQLDLINLQLNMYYTNRKTVVGISNES
jgi:hypothetical protein